MAEDRSGRAKFREIVANVVGELRSEELTRSYASITIEELVDQHIAYLSETVTQGQPSRMDRVKHYYDSLVNNLEDMKAMAPEEFDTRNSEDDDNVNTPPEG